MIKDHCHSRNGDQIVNKLIIALTKMHINVIIGQAGGACVCACGQAGGAGVGGQGKRWGGAQSGKGVHRGVE
jgi:hypothetical protein